MLEKGRRSVTAALSPKQFIVRLVLAAVFVCAIAITVPATVFAQSAPDAATPVLEAAQAAGVDGSVSLPVLIGRIINVFFGFLGIVLLGYILYAGYLWMTASGEPKRVQQAKDTIRNAIIGLVIIVSSFAIVRFILGQFGGLNDPDGFFGGNGNNVSLNGFPHNMDSLGTAIRDVYPSPGARNVPRNTGIIVTFREPIRVNTLIQDYDDHGTPDDLNDDVATSTRIGLNVANVRIYRTSEGRTRALNTSQVRVRFTPDRQTFVFRPVEYLGSSAEPQDYSVELVGGPSGILRESGDPALTSPRFIWQFQVSTVADLTPPQITGVIPNPGGTYAPNVVVQLNFSEPMDPTSAAGRVRGGAGFNNIELSAQAASVTTRPDGEFRVSNAYMTSEFVSTLACGVNSCGRQIYCLPFESAIRVDAKAATLERVGNSQAAIVSGLYDGLVDASGNSLDGNAPSGAQGPPADTYTYTFRTDETVDRNPPFIQAFNPPPDAGMIPVDQSPTANFNSILQSSTVHSGNVGLVTNEPPSDTFWFRPRMVNLIAGRVAALGEAASSSQILIDHRVYAAATDRFAPEYYPSIGSGVQNMYQNCFNPASSDNTTRECRATADRPHCCNGIPSASACPYPVIPRS